MKKECRHGINGGGYKIKIMTQCPGQPLLLSPSEWKHRGLLSQSLVFSYSLRVSFNRNFLLEVNNYLSPILNGRIWKYRRWISIPEVCTELTWEIPLLRLLPFKIKQVWRNCFLHPTPTPFPPAFPLPHMSSVREISPVREGGIKEIWFWRAPERDDSFASIKLVCGLHLAARRV